MSGTSKAEAHSSVFCVTSPTESPCRRSSGVPTSGEGLGTVEVPDSNGRFARLFASKTRTPFLSRISTVRTISRWRRIWSM
jgi:hypothetical protein